MMKFSSTAVLLIVAPFITGSSWSGSIMPQRDVVRVHVNARLLPLLRGTPPTAPTPVLQGKSAAAGDLWLTIVLGGALVALQLRRTQKSARVSRLC
jgi:hypothetical protein